MLTALIIGALGQDGTYLSSYLKSLGYRVIGTTHRKKPQYQTSQQDALDFMDLNSQESIDFILAKYHPDEIYNLGGVSSSADLFSSPQTTADVNGMGVIRLLLSTSKNAKKAKVFLALSSEIFAGTQTCPQGESTPPRPLNPYGISKTFAWSMASCLRSQWDLNISVGILYNHESPLRPSRYLSRKLSIAVAKISLGQHFSLQLGSPCSRRDWGYAGDFVRAMHQVTSPGLNSDFIIATGISHSVEDFCREAFDTQGLDYREFVDFGSEIGRVPRDESVDLRGNIEKIRNATGWQPTTSFRQMIAHMVDVDIYLQLNPTTQFVPLP